MEDKDPSPEVVIEDDRTVPVISELASEAVALFSSQKYADCVDVLNQLLAKKEGDMKVLHNLAISEYFRDGCSDPRKLLEKLCKLKKRCEEFASSSDEHVDNATPNGDNISGSKESGSNIHHQSSIKSKSCITYVDEFENSILTMNIAILMYHLHEYARAFTVMEPLYQNLDPYDEPTVLHVCILFLDIALAANEATKAAAIIRKLESFLGDSIGIPNSSDKGNTTHHQSQNQASQTSTVNNTATQEISTSDSSTIHKNSLSRSLSDDALEYEKLYSTLDGSSQTLGTPSFNRAAATANDLKLKLQMYKIHLLLVTRNLKAAKREIKLSVNSVRGRDLSTELLLKAQVEYARGNNRKAVKLLMMTYSDKTEPRLLSIYNNNLGCIHYSQKAPHTSGIFFAKALRNTADVRLEKPRKLSSFSDDKSSMICYNFGIQNLTCGKPLPAAKCFSKATLIFYDHPLLWLRLAECCLLAFEKGILGKNDTENIIVNVVGSGTWRRLIVEDFKSGNSYPLKEVNDNECRVSLPFARYCLHTALFLLNRNEQKLKPTVDSNGNSKEEKGILETSALAYEDMKREENHMIRQAVLADLAYNELLLENPLKSLSFSKMLLELPECSKIYVFLGNTYAAEALCKLNRVEEAVEHLSVYLDNEDVVLPYSDDDRVIWSLKRGTFGEYEDAKSNIDESNGSIFMMANEAKGITYLNMVSIYVMRGEIEKASQFASKALSLLPDNPKVLLASVYVDLLQGKTQEGISKLKEFNHVSYVSTNIHLSQ